MDLGRARSQLDQDPERARDTIDGALTQARDTVEELRSLSRGIAPPVLVDRGMEAALTHRPDLSIVDVRMPPSHTDEGLRAVVEVRREWPEARVMVLSQPFAWLQRG